MKSLKVRVTAKDIREGEREQKSLCPVAIAIARVSQGQPFVYADFVKLYVEGGFYNVGLPQKVVDFIIRFDDASKVKPFSFTLELGPLQ